MPFLLLPVDFSELWNRTSASMLQNATLHDPILINSIGHTAGLLVFGLIITLLVRDGRAHGIGQARLSVAAASLAFGWNLGSLIAIALGHRSPVLSGFVITGSFSVLSFLPAVLFHVALRGRQMLLVVTGYLVSTCAVFLHFTGLLTPDFGAHQLALATVVFGFGLLIIAGMFVLGRKNPGKPAGPPEWISLTCLLLFTTSFLHFGYQHGSSPWAAEVTWHHIGIPVVLIVLLQDYRFLLLDTFSRFLLNVGLAALYMAGLFLLIQRWHFWEIVGQNTCLTGLSLVGICLSLVLFAHVRNTLQAWMSRVIFHRRSTEDCAKFVVKTAAVARSEDEFLTRAAEEVARHIQTDRFAVLTELRETKEPEKPSFLFGHQDSRAVKVKEFSVEAKIPLHFSSGDARYLILGARRGGRRYFSEDLEDMRLLGSVIVEQVERFRADELKQLVAQAELRALQAQINPHFLFNALNTLYGIIDRNSFDARRMVLNLADIFRYSLQGDRVLIQLSEELRIVEAYLEIESLRLGDRLETELIVSQSARDIMIPILSIQPLVENAIKHGVAEKSGGGRVSLRIDKISRGLQISVEDTGVGFARSRKKGGSGASVGLENVRRRLLLCHGPGAQLHIHSDETGSVVSFFLPDNPSYGKPLISNWVPSVPKTGRSSISAEH